MLGSFWGSMHDLPLYIVAFAVSMIGTLLAIFCYFPGAIKVMKTNDTRAISLLMFSLTFLGCIIWVIYAILLLIWGSLSIKTTGAAILGGTGTLISNFGLGVGSGIIMVKKIINMNKAKKEGLTEDQYFKKYFEAKALAREAEIKAKKEQKESLEQKEIQSNSDTLRDRNSNQQDSK